MTTHAQRVAVVGAGPYGLSLATHLKSRGVSFRIFGDPMRFWRDMPRGLFLKSFAFATTIDNPEGLSYDAWCRDRGLEDREPCSMESFTEYGLWLQQRLVPEVENKEVSAIEARNGGFVLTLSSGELVEAQRVVVAVGLRHYQRIPEPLAHLPRDLLSHSSQCQSFDKFRDQDVCVIGAGQSALEAAALLHEAGARPLLIARREVIFYGKTPEKRPLLERIRNPITVLGAGRMHWVLQHFPWAVHWLPERKRVPFTQKYLGPSGAWWLRDRFEGKVPVRSHCELVSARAENGGVLLRVRRNGVEEDLRADHVVAGTGFEVDLDRLPFLAQELRARIARVSRAPRLDRYFQSSVPGLYFAGVTAMLSFGPLVRFVTGTSYCVPVVARHLQRQARAAAAPGLGPTAGSSAAVSR
jgi:FAD-dependent urate hydroxylase